MKNHRLTIMFLILLGFISPSLTLANSEGVTIAVDPVDAFTGSWSVEWNSAGNFESWVAVNATALVAGGNLSGTATSTDSRVQRTSIGSGPDLDLGWNDFLELRIQVPSSYTGPIQIFYGTSYTGGFSSEREVDIPSSQIPSDGAFHTYRIDLGLEPAWRSTLTDLRVDPVDGAGSSGMAFAIDYVRIGDEPNAQVYQTIITDEMPVAGGTTPAGATYGGGQTVYSMESKHFRFLWNDAVTANGLWTTDMPHGTLRNAEEVWQVHAKLMGYREPCFTMEDPTGSGGTTRGKINISTWYGGYWAGGDWDGSGTRCRFNATPDGLRVDPPTWVLPHELMHDFQFVNNQNSMPGSWYEGHANYGAERWLEHYQYLYPNTSSLDPAGVKYAHQILCDGRDEYLTWLPFLYMDTNPDNLPDLGEGIVAQLWQQNVAGQNPFNVLDTIAPTTGLKDIFGHCAQHGATLNYPAQPSLADSIAWDTTVPRFQFTDLVERPDDPSWWRVPYEMAPQQGGYTIHELVVPNPGTPGRTVTVNFHGLPDSGRGADWRAGFIVVADDNSERYSSLWDSGSNSVTLAANENTLYIAVAGTPDAFEWTDPDESVCSYRSAPGKARFPYEMQVTGATPKERDNGDHNGLVQHANGGGWKAATASVASSAYLGPNARVLGTATVSGNARIEDYAVVQDNAQVSGNALVSGHAWVKDNAIIQDYAKVRDWAIVRENATVSGNGRALEHADVLGSSTVTDQAVVKGTAQNTGGSIIGNAILDGNYYYWRNVTNGFVTGHLPYVGIPDSWITPLPTGLYAAYNFASDHDSRILDQYGVTDGFAVGSPTWTASDGTRSGILTFGGSSQYVNLDRSVVDLHDFTFTAWVKPAGGTGNQAVLWLGASSTQRMYFTPDNGSGQATFSIVNGGSEQSLTASSALAPGAWSHVAITLDGTTGTLYVNGTSVASGAITIRPEQLLAPNTATGGQQNYLARSEGSIMPMFSGSLDDVRFYAQALPASAVEDLGASVPILLINPGFELPAAGKIQDGFDGAVDVPGWSNADPMYNSGIEAVGAGPGSYAGDYSATMRGPVSWDPTPAYPAYQLTSHTIAAGDVFTVDFAAAANWMEAATGEMSVNLYYDDAGSRVTMDTVTVSGLVIGGGWTLGSLSVAADDYPSSIDNTIGIEFKNTGNGWTSIDDFSLSVSNTNAPDASPPAAPTALIAIADDGSVGLDWADNTEPDWASYTVYRSTTSGNSYVAIASGLTASTNADDTVSNGTPYYYVVTATDTSGNESAYSSEVSAVPSPATYTAEESAIAYYAVAGGTNLSLTVSNTVLGHWYTILATDTLTPPSWTTNVIEAGTGSNVLFGIPIDPASTNRYFKLIVEQQ